MIANILSTLAKLAILALGVNAHADLFKPVRLETYSAEQPSASKTEESYYDQFTYAVHGDCKKIESMWFRSSYAFEPAELGLDAQNRKVVATVSIQLYQGGGYYAEYEEFALSELNTAQPKAERVFFKPMTGTWVVSGKQILIDGLGIGTPAKIFSSEGPTDSIRFRITNIFSDRRILTSSMNIAREVTNHGPFGMSINQYCEAN